MAETSKRIVVVTGGSRGIGRSICISMAEADTHIYFNYFNPGNPDEEAEKAKETESAIIEAGGSATSVSVDVVSEPAVNAFFDKVMEEAGRIDVLVNNAGITRDGLLVRMKTTDWDAVLDTNLKGTFLCTQAVAKIMMKQRYGRIVNIASVVGAIGNAGQANYSASKAGVIGFTKSVAKELAPRGVTVNAVAPGFIETDMTAVLPDKVKEALMKQIPLGHIGKPEDVAAAIIFLASDDASYITGQVIHVNGGMF
ncbi:MAG: 3-oxoacyl-[acyl-carrier-protein] reductase [Deltaproteobacteria bacterium]|nr:3-oxoacyl-[acyl-carrier-protein] reductase [Deltaproteobacteria bacterium]